uniref:Uncharacterized protein n=1 Tax=Magallana gigas TaxID=29159 RepID=K1PPX5_MAGGI
MDQRRRTIEEWILRRKEAWRFQEELLVKVTDKQTNKGQPCIGGLTVIESQRNGSCARGIAEKGGDQRKKHDRQLRVLRIQKHLSQTLESASLDLLRKSMAPYKVSHVKPAAAKCLCEVKRSKGQGVFRRLKKYFGF